MFLPDNFFNCHKLLLVALLLVEKNEICRVLFVFVLFCLFDCLFICSFICILFICLFVFSIYHELGLDVEKMNYPK